MVSSGGRSPVRRGPEYEQPARRPSARPVGTRRQGPPAGLLIGLLVLVLLLLLAVAVWFVFRGDPSASSNGSVGLPTSGVSPSAPAVSAASSTTQSDDSINGPLMSYATASAPSTSRGSFDNSGASTSYEAALMLDDDPRTTWRMDGDGTDTVLTFTLDTPRQISQLGLINGFAKVDPDGNVDRYVQARRILSVVWTVGSKQISQTLTDGDRSYQRVSFNPVVASEVQLRITSVTGPGTVNRTAISDVLLANR